MFVHPQINAIKNMITIDNIKKASSTIKLNALLDKAAFERGCELDRTMTYKEQAEFFNSEIHKTGNGQDTMQELIAILNTAETKFFELEG